MHRESTLAVGVDELLQLARRAFYQTGEVTPQQQPLLGIDLGTASIILVALDSSGIPLACEMQRAEVVRDGLVVDYFGASQMVRRLKENLENRLGVEFSRAAIAVPPGTGERDTGTHRHVVESCGLEVAAVVVEPTAANEVLQIQNGAVVDIGGGTTGLTIFRDGEAVYTADEPTGGTHLSLVLMGARHITFDEAEELKRNLASAQEVLDTVKPVIEKMATIVQRHMNGNHVQSVHLVGGTCRLPGVERLFAEILGIPVYKPADPMLVTPLGIALSCGKG